MTAATARAATAKQPAEAGRGRFAALDLFRAVAAPMVVYGHIVELWLPDHHVSSPAVDLLDRVARAPLHLQQTFSHLGVVLFFLVSGFIITHTGVRQRHREFAVKRLLRIYPPLAVAVLLCAGLISLGMKPLTTGQDATVSPFTVLTNTALVNYLLVPQVVLIGVAWTLIIEMIFYAVTFLILPLLRRAVWAAIAVELLAVWLVVLTARDAGENWFLFAVSFSYLPVLLVGQIVWAVWSGRVPFWAGGLFGAAAWVLYVWAGGRDMGRIDDSYDVTMLIAVLLFVIAVRCEPVLRRRRLVGFLADRSYSIYLMHGLVAFPVMDAMFTVAPAGVAVAAGLVVIVIASDLSYRLVERPSQRLARALTRARRAASTPDAATPDAAAPVPATSDPAAPDEPATPETSPLTSRAGP